MKRTCAISSAISFLISVDICRMRPGIERKHHRKDERDCGEKDRKNPLGRVTGSHACRAYLDGEPRNYCKAERDAINLPLFQLTEERAHLSPRRLRASIGYSRPYVETGIPGLFFSPK